MPGLICRRATDCQSCKKPADRNIKEANAGGTVAAAMLSMELKLIIVEDMPQADAGWKVIIY